MSVSQMSVSHLFASRMFVGWLSLVIYQLGGGELVVVRKAIRIGGLGIPHFLNDPISVIRP